MTSKNDMLISVIVTTYNRPDALTEVMHALLDQTDRNFEVIIADDGSAEPTRQAILPFRKTSRSRGPQRFVHAWQPDDGFRASAARNLGVFASRGEYLIFLDGDCVPRPDFVARHRLLAEAGFMVSGSRVLLSEQFTQRLLSTDASAPVHSMGLPYWMMQRILGNANKVVPLLHFPDTRLRHYRSVKWSRIKSCNLAMWRSDYAAVNGFDESFVGWGHEDADLVLRLARHGVRRKGGAFSTEVFHLWHRENTRATESENRQRVEERMRSGLIKAESGLSAHPKPEDRIET
ncbi:glycosyltransferase [Noviherbaspirillum cavernae]|uniref:Glycosyltransferase n=1 Tax=Noviherbaspirillum cavernae TaxID=2320862 RepID=A0A418X3L1_9BURK|nr:glycosyltransferase family 2 protein [Noviherbaspirillum cavernae]RJG06981.1 glycosyltransferase [Noviherbaspirillum cavernae]